jgi:hypothetical protein
MIYSKNNISLKINFFKMELGVSVLVIRVLRI